MQSRILKEKKLTFISLGFVLGVLFFWYFVIYTQDVLPPDTGNYTFERIVTLVDLGLQRQLFWGVVALSLFVGFFQFLAVINNRMSFFWVRAIFVCFASMLAFNVTRIADQYKWVAEWEQRPIPLISHIPIESEAFHNAVLPWLPHLVFIFCLVLWLLFLFLFVERMTRNTIPNPRK